MFEGIGELLTAWRSVLHLAEWTGLSLSALAGCAAGLYFGWQIPLVRRLLLLTAFGVALLWAGLIHGGAVERRDVMAQWNAAKIKAAREAKARDIEIEMEVHKTYLPEIADLQRQAADRQHQVEQYEQQMLAMATGGSCRLGPDAFRLRGQPQRK